MSKIVVDKKKLDLLRGVFKKGGTSNVQIISDFDRTLTKAFVDSEYVPSIISALRNGNYLSENYRIKAHELFTKYNPIEIDAGIPEKIKYKLMHKWWKEHYELLTKERLHKDDVKKAVHEMKLEMREGFYELIELLKLRDIPLTIFSSSGLGVGAIEQVLSERKVDLENIHIISNQLIWNENGYLKDVKKPIIHVMNKNQKKPNQVSFYKEIQDRCNVILLGDSLGDVEMAEGTRYENIIKIGYLNRRTKEYLMAYKQVYDLIVTEDGSLNPVIELLQNTDI